MVLSSESVNDISTVFIPVPPVEAKVIGILNTLVPSIHSGASKLIRVSGSPPGAVYSNELGK